jgi:ribosomal protein S18 acetylase RimI-like enzyme
MTSTMHDDERTGSAAPPDRMDHASVTIRRLAERDADAYRALWMKGIVETPQFFRIAPQDDGADALPTDEAPGSFTLGAFAQGRLVGVVSLRREAFAKLRHKALVFRMYVDPDSAGTGIGRALMTRLIDEAGRHDDLRQIHLTVLASNTRAIGLYESLGFIAFARETDAVKIGEVFVDELQMARRLR